MAVRVLLPDGAAIAAVDGTLLKKRGKKVFGAAWQYHGAARGNDGVGLGVCFVVVGVIVEKISPSRMTDLARVALVLTHSERGMFV